MPRNTTLERPGTEVAKPRPRPVFRPTLMSIALMKAGVIPGLHMVEERSVRQERTVRSGHKKSVQPLRVDRASYCSRVLTNATL